MSANLWQMQTYLDSLPRGFDSFPEHVQKASVYRVFLGAVPMTAYVDSLPEPLRKLVLTPLPHSTWIPEVTATALYLAMRDLHFKSDNDFVEMSYVNNKKLLEGPLYAFLFKLVPVSTVLRGAQSRWEQLHRGVELKIMPNANKQSASFRMSFPPALVPTLLARCYAAAFRAALDLTGARRVKLELADQTSTHALFEGSWEP